MQNSTNRIKLSSNDGNDAITVKGISLPKGGGAIQGISEKIQVQDFTGSAGFSLPVFTSPCREITPTLSITYSSGSGNSEFGLGWSINIPKITRKTSLGIPQYNNKDTFLLNGSQDLILSNNPLRTETINNIQYNISTYLVRYESDFPLIEYWQSNDNTINSSFWKITDKNHNMSLFGVTKQSQLVDPANNEHIFTWFIEEKYNSKGDHQLWFYKKEDTTNISQEIYENNRVQTANLYLERIRYGNNTPVINSMLLSNNSLVNNANCWHFEAVFDYGEYDIDSSNNNPYQPLTIGWLNRDDSFSLYNSGFEIRYHRLCKSTLMFHRFTDELGANPILVHATQYSYGSNHARISELRSTTNIGYKYNSSKGYSTISLPNLEFEYTSFNPQAGKFLPITENNGNNLPVLTEGQHHQLVDLFGEGIPGILYSDENTNYYSRPHILKSIEKIQNPYGQNPINSPLSKKEINSSSSGLTYQPWEILQSFPIRSQIENSHINLTDITGDGKLDLIATSSSMKGYWEINPNETWQNYKNFLRFPTDFQAPNQDWVDVNGTGLNDLIQITENCVRVYPSAGHLGFGLPIIVNDGNPISLPNTLESSPKKIVKFANIDGSGRQHIVLIEALFNDANTDILSISYWPNLGYGKFGEKVTMSNPPHIDKNFDSRYLFFADLDGSGAADLIFLKSEEAIIYFNYNGNSFSDPLSIPFPINIRFDNTMQVEFADILGRGTNCLIISDPKSINQNRHFYYDFCQGIKPYLIQTIDNNQGAKTLIEYGSSVDFYLADKEAGLPWVTKVPFPVHTVTKTTYLDEISNSKLISKYAYHHGYYDGREREFRGFGRVDRQDAEYFTPTDYSFQEDPRYVTPTLTKTWYHTGCFVHQKQLLAQYEKEYFQGDKLAFLPPLDIIDCNDSVSLPQAYAVLSGKMLRSEVYALDNSILVNNPYSVVSSNYKIRLLQAQDTELYAVFTSNSLGSLTYTYERNPEDPQIHQEFILKVDEYGNVKERCSVAYGRRKGSNVLLEQLSLKLLYYSYNYINEVEVENYLIGALVESKTYSIGGLTAPVDKAFSLEEIYQDIQKALTNSSPLHVELISWKKIRYAKVEQGQTVILDFGEVNLPLLVGRQEIAEFSQENISKIFAGALEGIELKSKLIEGFYQYDETNQYWWNFGLQDNYNGIEQYYLPTKTIDQAGNTANYTYDKYSILLTIVEDALSNKTQALDIDYQTLHPGKLLDPNERIKEVSFDPLGRVIYTSTYGFEDGLECGFDDISKAPNVESPALDDIVSNPSKYLGAMNSYFYYDSFAWKDRREPLLVVALIAENYSSSQQLNSPIQIHLTYSDGFGRELQSKNKVEPGEAYVYDSKNKKYILKQDVVNRWRNSGRKEYNNKGKIVRAYEPYFTDTPYYVNDKMLDTFGVSSTTHYDPLERVIKILTPKGFLNTIKWTAWEQVTYDSNDTIIESPYYQVNIAKPDQDSSFYDKNLTAESKKNIEYCVKYFYDTPTKTILDNLGRVIIEQRINKYPSDPTNQSSETIIQTLNTYYIYDMLGRILESSDPRLSQSKLSNFKMNYCMASNQSIKTVSADSGESWSLLNTIGNTIFTYDSRGIQKSFSYDALNRLTEISVKKSPTNQDLLELNQITQSFIYGDSKGINIPLKYNLKGKIYYSYDEAGLVVIPSYSLEGKPLKNIRQFLKDYKNEVNWNNVDFLNPNNAQVLLQPEQYITQNQYDALSRVIQEIDADQNQVTSYYHLSGMLAKNSVLTKDDNKIINYIEGITYNAKEQPIEISYANSTKTTYLYDPKTFLPVQIATVNKLNKKIQDIGYQYDPVGNIFQKNNHIEQNTYFNNQNVSPIITYKYNALYRVIQGTGREKVGSGKIKDSYSQIPLFIPSPKDSQAIQNYIENYQYDVSGNLVKTEHIADLNNWTRNVVVSDSSNRAIISSINNNKYNIPTPNQVNKYFDLHGNQIKTQNISPLNWDYRNQLKKIITVKHEDGSYNSEHYVYDLIGQRKRKIYEQYSSTGNVISIKETIYLGNIEIRRTSQNTDTTQLNVINEYHSLRLKDGNNCVATRYYWTIGKPIKGFESSSTLYSLQDEQDSYLTQLDNEGNIVSQEEYSPYGETTLFIGSGSADQLKHYRYSAKEKDVTGFYYYGARYYFPMIGRWLNPDPAGPINGLNIFIFVTDNPIDYTDLWGLVKTYMVSPHDDVKNFAENAIGSSLDNITNNLGNSDVIRPVFKDHAQRVNFKRYMRTKRSNFNPVTSKSKYDISNRLVQYSKKDYNNTSLKNEKDFSPEIIVQGHGMPGDRYIDSGPEMGSNYIIDDAGQIKSANDVANMLRRMKIPRRSKLIANSCWSSAPTNITPVQAQNQHNLGNYNQTPAFGALQASFASSLKVSMNGLDVINSKTPITYRTTVQGFPGPTSQYPLDTINPRTGNPEHTTSVSYGNFSHNGVLIPAPNGGNFDYDPAEYSKKEAARTV